MKTFSKNDEIEVFDDANPFQMNLKIETIILST